MTEQALDDLLRRVLRDAARQEYAVLGEDIPEHRFSPAFERKMKTLIRCTDHPIRHRLGQVAACLLLAALLSGCSLLAFSPAARAALAGWVQEIYESWSIYQHHGEEQPVLEDAVYHPTWVPPEYKEILAPDTGIFVHALYEARDGSLLRFSYLTGLPYTSLEVDRTGAEVVQTTVGEQSAELYQNPTGGPSILVWADEDKDVVFWLTAPLDGETLVKIAESVEKSGPMVKRYRLSWLPMTSWFPELEYGAFFLSEESKTDTRGETIFEGERDISIAFGYSLDQKNDPPYPEKTGTSEATQVGDLPAELYRSKEDGGDNLLVWHNEDGSEVLWVRAPLPKFQLLQLANSVVPDLNDLTNTMEISTWEPGTEPLLDKVEQALTDEWVAQVEAYAQRDAEAGIYMQADYTQMVRAYQAQHISPQREDTIARVTPMVEQLMETQQMGEHVLNLFGPFYSASISVRPQSTTAHLCDEYGEMIAGYNSHSGEWIDVPTKAEMQFSYETTQIYFAAYRAARAEQP